MEKGDRSKYDVQRYMVPGREKFSGGSVLNMGIAVMHYPTPEPITEALRERMSHPDYSYMYHPEELRRPIVDRLKRSYDWEVRPEWIVWTPKVISSLTLGVMSVGQDGDTIAVQTPIYAPIMDIPRRARRISVKVPLVPSDNGWEMDYESLERTTATGVSALLFCNPHNPVGRMYSREELQKVSDICKRNNLVVCSDEIFSDLTLDRDKKHIPFGSLDEETAQRSITVMSPSKTFDLSGFSFAFAVIPNEEIRDKFIENRALMPPADLGGITAARVIYPDVDGQCEAWRLDLIDILRANRDIVASYASEIPGLTMNHVEATYLALFDVRGLRLDDPVGYFLRAGVEVVDGKKLDAPGFVRLNFAHSPEDVHMAMQKITALIP